MINLIPKLPFFWTFRRFGYPSLLPFSLVVSVSFRCNSRCKTCGVWRKAGDDMTLEEWDRVFSRLGHGPVYITFTGGEPFLRPDLADLVGSAYEHCRPNVITIPTNGLLTRRIGEQVETMCRVAPACQIGINLSLDDIGVRHDEIRQVPGNWQRAMATWKELKGLQRCHHNLVLSAHTVISRFNVERFSQIYAGLSDLNPDSYITEVAEERVELDTVDWSITPPAETYGPVADLLTRQARDCPVKGLARVTQAFRAEYYQLAKRVLFEHRQVVPCYAGWASGHIAPNGDVWSCCIRAEPVGNLREHGYDLRPVWDGAHMKALRDSIRRGDCACPMANAGYANMLLHPPTVFRALGHMVSGFS